MKQAALYQISEDGRDEHFMGHLQEEASIGKSPNADFHIRDWRCNGIHALIKRNQEGTYTIVDLGSTYGMKVNNKEVRTATLDEGDEFKIGNLNIVLRYLNQAGQDEATQMLSYKRPQPNQDNQQFELAANKSILEVGLHWGEQLLEIQTFEPGSDITIGNPKFATFGIPLSSVKNVRKSYKLASYKGKQLELSVPSTANGLIWTENKTIALDTLRFYDNSYQGKDNLEINLRVGDRAHVEFGELALSFKFVSKAEKVPLSFLPKWDPQLIKAMVPLLLLYLIAGLYLLTTEPEIKEKKLADIPMHLKKTIFEAGVKNAKKKQKSAIGQIAENIGGRSRAEEGQSTAKKSPVKPKPKQKKPIKKQKKKIVKKDTKKRNLKPAKKVAKKKPNVEKQVAKIDLDSSFKSSDVPDNVLATSVVSKTTQQGNTASALANGNFARGSSGLGAGGGGQSVGIGALSGNATGGGMGTGDVGLAPSKGREIQIPEMEEIKILGGLDPDIIAAIIKRYLPQIQYCYEQQLTYKANLRGKVTVSFTIMGNGSVSKQKVVETSLNDTATEKCILTKVSKWKFPKPKGGGTVGVKYPFILMSSSSQ